MRLLGGDSREICASLRGVTTIVGFLAAVCFGGDTHAQEQEATHLRAFGNGGPEGPVAAFNGSYTYSVGIDVPGFRGIEPALALSYNSASDIRNIGNNGAWIGVGWALSGVSAVERVTGAAAPAAGQPKLPGGRGSPGYGAAGLSPDTFTIDGEELILCSELQNPSSSPSCSAPVPAGSIGYSGRFENYTRIRQNPTANVWEITDRDGTKYEYSTTQPGASATTFRWNLSKVTDRRGNHVDYSYSCPAAEECTLSTIVYVNQGSTSPIATITFHYEQRPETLSRATGAGILANSSRLKTVRVLMGSDLVRAYKLAYETSVATSLSRLAYIQQYGRDATFDGSMTVTGGKALPATSFTYSNLDLAQVWTPGPTWTRPPPVVGDFNGDGRMDACDTSRLYISNGTGFTSYNQNCITAALAQSPGSSTRRVTDYIDEFTGSGADEVLEINQTGTWGCTPTSTGQTCTYTFSNEYLGLWKWNGATWTSLFGTTNGYYFDGGVLDVGDFGGDGKADFTTANSGVWQWNGTTLVKRTGWSVPSWTAGATRKTGDFNGDGKVDILIIYDENSNRYGKVYLSTGAAFVEQARFLIGNTTDVQDALLGDVNADGRTDLVRVANRGTDGYGVQIFLSNGKSLPDRQNALAEQLFSGYTYRDVSYAKFAEVNGDGRGDLVLVYGKDTNNGRIRSRYYRALQSTGAGFNQIPNVSLDRVTSFGDFDNDGRTDYGGLDVSLQLSSGDTPPDLLTNIVEPLGGKIAIEYESSSGKPNTKLPFVMHVVKAITLDDGRGTPGSPTWESKTSYTYEGGAWNAAERQFLGFRKVTAQLPAVEGETVGPQVASTYQQSVQCLGRTSEVERRDGANILLRKVTDNYMTDTEAPFICLNSSTTADEIVSGQTKTVKTERTFNAYGLVTNEYQYGDLAVTGDERSSSVTFIPNTTDYVVACPHVERTYSSLTQNSSTMMTSRGNFYEGMTNWDEPALSCQKETVGDWISSTSAWAWSTFTYDAYGNQTVAVGPENERTEQSYDTTNQLFPVETRLPKYFGTGADARFKIQSQWDMVCGALTHVTDINGQNTNSVYDALCRQTRQVMPGGSYLKTIYNIGTADVAAPGGIKPNPSGQLIETQRPAPHASTDNDDWSNPSTLNTGTDVVWSQVFIDGFGRKWSDWNEGVVTTPGQLKRFQTQRFSYNKRGAVRYHTQMYFGDAETAQWTNYYYDALDRLIDKDMPDGKSVTLSYGLGNAASTELSVITQTDEIGQKTRLHYDAYGDMVQRMKMRASAGDPEAITQYKRDALGRIVEIYDPNNNKWTYNYDGMSRRTGVHDPDLGDWAYTYDTSGRLLTQTDAKGQVSTLTYDSMGRALTKTVTGLSLATETTTNTYDQTRSGYFNAGQLTKAVKVRAGTPNVTVSDVETDYDVAGRPVKQAFANINGSATPKVIESTYWRAGELRNRTFPSGAGSGSGTYTAAYDYDEIGRLYSVKNGTTDLVSAMTYNGQGQMTSASYGNGVSTSYGYNAQRAFLTSITTSNGSTSLMALTYTRDFTGRITAVTNSTVTSNVENWTYTYNDLGELTGADNQGDNTQDQTWTYDLAGNMLTNSKVGTYVYPTQGPTAVRPHAPNGIAGQAVSYDANGNTTGYTASGQTRTFTYDGENRPLSIAIAGGATTTFDYGADGARTKKTSGTDVSWYLGGDTELIVDAVNPAGAWGQ